MSRLTSWRQRSPAWRQLVKSLAAWRHLPWGYGPGYLAVAG